MNAYLNKLFSRIAARSPRLKTKTAQWSGTNPRRDWGLLLLLSSLLLAASLVVHYFFFKNTRELSANEEPPPSPLADIRREKLQEVIVLFEKRRGQFEHLKRNPVSVGDPSL